MKEQFSVITISYNEENRITKTIESVLNQTYSDFEYIIIDGKSEDNTVAIIERYSSSFSKRRISFCYSSEKDSGLYNAMNKALGRVCGKYTIFLNAGDTFENENVLADIANDLDDSIDVLFGSTRVILNDYWRVDAPQNYTGLSECMPFCHQSVFTKTELLIKHGFDEQYRISADYDFFLKLYEEQAHFVMTDIIISRFPIGGISYDNCGKNEFLERTSVRFKHGVINENERDKLLMCFEKKYRRMRFKGVIRLIIPSVLLKPVLNRRYIAAGWTRMDSV